MAWVSTPEEDANTAWRRNQFQAFIMSGGRCGQ
jgi:hypothetical protein